MELFNNPQVAPASFRNAAFLRLLAGMLVAAIVAAISFGLPFGHSLSWSQLLGIMLEQVFTVSVVCAATVSVLSPAILHKNKSEFLALVRLASVTALWIAPLTLFMRENSFWSVPIAAPLAIAIAVSFDSAQDIFEIAPNSLLITLHADAAPLKRRFGLQKSILAALAIQIGVLLALGGHIATGTFLAACSFTIWATAYSKAGGLRSPRKSSPLLTMLVVAALMIAGLLHYLQHSYGSHVVTAHRGLFPHPSSGKHEKTRARFDTSQVGTPQSGSPGDQGIILWGEKRNLMKLIAPSPILPDALANGNSNPLIIPFNGVYWFFKSPDEQPPAGSRQAHASPDAVEIRSTDHRPLSIEAHDHLANLINLDCCNRIQIAIRNADRYPDTVSLELVLANTSRPHSPWLSLGRTMVNSTREWKIYEKAAPVSETLTFAIPSHRSLRSFDEVTVVFFLDRARADAAARIAIDHFVLIPRGL
ncbi:MAG TPA: hypothetical protein VGS27_19085 [Candidatus Sulfotelmatobacter sp.]|nr:hypothetical protein [Candidatus Sulfotelmatobacter sp.]